MRIAILGAGGVGGFLAAKLIRAGHDVGLLARGAHLEAIRSAGLTLIENGRSTTVCPKITTDDAAALGPADLAIVAVKAHQLEALMPALSAIVGPDTQILPFQNGVEAPAFLARHFGDDRTAIGVARIFANITAPGVINQYGTLCNFVFGRIDGSQASPSIDTWRRVFAEAGVDAPACADVTVDLWVKALGFNGVSGTTAGGRTTIGTVRASPMLWRLFQTIVAETAAVGRARGVRIPPEAEAAVEAMVGALPDQARASTAHDLEAGKPLEIDYGCGAIARLGADAGIPTPACATIAAILEPWKHGAPPERGG